MRNFYKNIALFILLMQCSPFGGWGAYAQLYPVQLTPIFNTPYVLKISEYANSMDTKMQLQINPTDFNITSKQVRLKLYIQGNRLNIQSSDYIQGQRPIYINGGELQTLTNNDIAALFRLENLQGISAAQYAAPLPDGMYNFCFEIYDFITNEKLSRKSCAMMYLQLNDPPILNIPAKNEQIVATDFPNILFNWTPRQINATNVSYKFELKQIIDPTLDPQIGFMMAPLLHEETVFSTALLYNLSMPILTPGMRYAWRVKAISTKGLSENAVFKNDGYSETFSFKYAANCAVPTFMLSQAQSAKSAKITWQSQPEHRKFHVQYRTKGVAKAKWFSVYTQNDNVTLSGLEPAEIYEFRVGETCEAEQYGIDPSYVYSSIQEFRMPEKKNPILDYNCGIHPNTKITNQTPLTNLIQSETFTAGDFPVTISELIGQSPYSGKGYVVVPYLADTKIAVEFNNIIINTDYQLINGIVETSYNPDWNNVADVEDHTGEGARGQIQEAVPFVISDIVINANGDIVVNGTNGEQVIIPGGKDTSITDGNGTVYHVDKNGNGSNQGDEAAKGGKSTPANTDGVDKNGQVTAFTAKGVKVEFTESNSSKYAFDVMPKKAPAALEKLYRKVGDVALPYKAVVNGQSDTVLATVTITDTIVKPENIVFKTQSGAKVDFNRNNNVFTLTVKGNQTYAEEQIIATILQGDKWKVIGAFELVHISPKEVNVALVPTDKTAQDKLGGIIKNAQEIYYKVGIKVNFTTAAILDISKITGDKIKTEKNTLTSTYSTEQQKINDRYQGADNSYVLFVTEKASSTGQAGYMRLNGKFGYVFAPSSATGGKTAAHELGHGIFKLEHPFELYKATEKATDLLMDYSDGTVLNHQDWKQINDPGFRLYSFQSQASGEYETDGHYSTVYLVSLMLGMDPVKAKALAEATEAPDTSIHDETKFELNDTWGHPGGPQQDIHSLTGGFHGIEEFFTAIKFLYAGKEDLKFQGEMLHRFGDTYAHTKLGNLQPEDLKENMNLDQDDDQVIKNYIDSWSQIKPEISLGSEIKPWIKFFNYYLRKDGFSFLNDEKKQRKIFKGRTLKAALKDLYLTNKSSDFIMYGKFSGFTFDHFASDGGFPDQIYLRPKWYYIYVQNLSWLISSKYQLNNAKLNLSVFDRMLSFVSENKCSMKGIIDYEIAKIRKQKTFYVPVFYADRKLLALIDENAISDYEKTAIEVVENTKKYMIEQGISPSKIKVTKTDRLVIRPNYGSSGGNGVNLSHTTQAFVITIN